MTHDHPLIDVGPATPSPSWCLPDAEPSWDHQLTEQFGGGTVCTWTRTFPEGDPHADVWLQAENGIIGGWVMRSAPRIMMFEPPCTLDDIGAGSTPDWESLSPARLPHGQKHVRLRTGSRLNTRLIA